MKLMHVAKNCAWQNPDELLMPQHTYVTCCRLANGGSSFRIVCRMISQVRPLGLKSGIIIIAMEFSDIELKMQICPLYADKDCFLD